MSLTISVEYDGESYVLIADCGRMSPTVAGPRLFKSEPHPRIQFSFDTIEAAQRDAAKLREYLAALPSRKPSKKDIRAQAD